MKRPWQAPAGPRAATARPLLAARARPLAAAVLAACVIVTAALDAWLAHRTRTVTLDRAVDHWVFRRIGGRGAGVMVARSLGNPLGVTVICAALVLGCLAARRYRCALLAAVAVPLAGALTEFALKPLFGRTYGVLSYPSGHVTGVSALAVAALVLLTGPARPPLPAVLRRALCAVALLAVVGVAVAMVAGRYHYFTGTIGGAATGTGTVLLTALVLDWVSPQLARRPPAAQEWPARRDITEPRARLPRT